MIHRTLLSAAVLTAFGLGVSLAAGETSAPVSAAPSAPAAPAAAVPPEQMLEAYGWFLGQDLEVYAFGLNDAEIAALARGIGAAAKGKPPPENIEAIGPAIKQFLATRPAEVQKTRLAAGHAEEDAFFATVDKKETVKKTDTGLRYEIISAGVGAKPGPNDTVTANYTGSFVDGTVFDSTAKRGEPAEFALSGVIPGWQQGLPLIGAGGKIKLYVPSKLGYGDTGRMNIPPGKALVFEVELISSRPEQPQLAPQGQPPAVRP